MSTNNLIKKIDELLPQTQCGLCTYGACRPYAEAIASQGEMINKCPPGGVKTLKALALLLNQDETPFLAEMQEKEKKRSRAYIREAECIGCTKCIQACPVDAILGAAKKMHTVMADECTGCDLCIEPCPVDCIEMIPLPPVVETLQQKKANIARERFNKRNDRIAKAKQEKTFAELPRDSRKEESIATRKSAILEAIERSKQKSKSNER